MLLYCLSIMLCLPQAQAVNSCTQHIQMIEKTHGIPKNLLAAMARVESGRYNKKTNTVEPWPWTVNSGGKSNYFDTKAEAVAYVKGLRAKGVKNIDIGCMQMNYEHHGHKFDSIEHMFEPSVNVSEGAKYLKQVKANSNRAWSTAVGNYHSFTPEHHNRYKTQVLKHLSEVNKGTKEMFEEAAPYARGSLFSGRARLYNTGGPGIHQGQAVRASLYSYSRSHGMTGARKPVGKGAHKIVKMTSKKRMAQMQSVGIYDLGFSKK